jgi:hypothetical protein
MKVYAECPRRDCAGEVDLTFERERADDGEWWVLTGAECSEGCDLTGDEIERLERENPVTPEALETYYEPIYSI